VREGFFGWWGGGGGGGGGGETRERPVVVALLQFSIPQNETVFNRSCSSNNLLLQGFVTCPATADIFVLLVVAIREVQRYCANSEVIFLPISTESRSLPNFK